MKYKVLVIDDEFLLRMTLESGLSDRGYQVEAAGDIHAGLALAENFHPDVVLLDNRLGNDRGLDYIDQLRQLDEEMQIILITAYGSVSQAVEAMKLGVSNYVLKPFDLDEIDLIIRRGMEQLANRRTVALMRRPNRELIGVSQGIQRIRQNIRVLAENDSVDVLIFGETGTGKEVIANNIHDGSARRDKPLVKINCGAIPENLLESELFGYEKGAFTGANKTKKGLMELANGGTVFLDEIGEMPLFMQSKLLTFLEDRRFKRVGGLRDIEVNVRIIAATNRRLEEEVRRGAFREDLFYRLNVMQLRIPPLRERPEDIPVLCQFYLKQFSLKFKKSFRDIEPGFLKTMERYDWKGNVRELRNVIERCALFSEGDFLSGAESGLRLSGQSRPSSGEGYPLRDLRQGAIDLKREVDAFELAYIKQAVELAGGNLSQAAQLLSTTRFTLKRRLDDGDPEKDPEVIADI